MGKRGPKPQPTSLKILGGTRADRVNHAEPVAPAGMPKPPTYLDKVGRAEWKRLAPMLSRMGVLTLADGAAMGVLCHAFARWREAEGKLQDEGPVIRTGLGGSKTSPWVGIADRAQERYVRMLAEFGCTPSARSRVKVGTEEPKDDLAEFLGKKGLA